MMTVAVPCAPRELTCQWFYRPVCTLSLPARRFL